MRASNQGYRLRLARKLQEAGNEASSENLELAMASQTKNVADGKENLRANAAEMKHAIQPQWPLLQQPRLPLS